MSAINQDSFITAIILIILAVIIGAIGVRLLVSFVVKRWRRWRDHMSKEQLKVKDALLANEKICTAYAPQERYVRELREKEMPKQFAWLSAYPRAVRASIKRNRGKNGQKLEARQQINEAAQYVTVTDLPENLAYFGDSAEHYRIDLKLNGRERSEVEKLREVIKAQLGLYSIELIDSTDTYTVSFAAHKVKPIDPLTQTPAGIEFFEENPATVPYRIPLAKTQRGKVWSLPTHHTLILGTTGSGKGSPLNGMIRQFAPFVEKGTVKLYGIDPKASELRPYEESSLFEEIAYESEPSMQIITEVHALMKKRSKEKKVDVEHAQLGRSLEATRETPMIVLLIDELLSLIIALQNQGREGRAIVNTTLTEILAQGRSLGVFVVGATQEADRDLLGRMRGNFANVIILRQINAYFNDLFLGDGAKERGFDSTAIPPANKSNGYATAGIGYVKEESGNPVKVRFAYSSDEDIAALIEEHPREVVEFTPRKKKSEPVEVDEIDDGGFQWESVFKEDLK